MMHKSKNTILFALLWLCIFSISFFSCSKEQTHSGESSFYLSINNERINKETYIYIPSEGENYNILIEISPQNLKWNISFEGDNYLNISKNSGNGDSEINITASKLPSETTTRKSTVNIQAEGCDKIYTIIFTQSQDLPLRFPRRTQYKIDNGLGQDPEDFEDPSSDFNIYNMVTTSHVALLWDKRFGKNPNNATPPYNFDHEKALVEAQKCYDFIIDELHFSNRTTSCATKTKFIVYVDYELGTGATGGGSDEVPVINVKPQALPKADGTYSILYHEMSHGFQYVAGWDNPESGINSDDMRENTTHHGIHEYTSQWTVMNKYTNFAEIQNDRFNDYMTKTHLAFPHIENRYTAPYLLEYWNEKHSKNNTQYGEFISRLWKEYSKDDNDDVIRTFKRITGLSQAEMMDEMWEAAAHNITWDFDLIRDDYDKYKNQHKTKLNKIAEGKYKINNSVCPQNYGYNAIKLVKFNSNSKIDVELTKTSVPELETVNPHLCDYRVGFMAYTKDGNSIYSENPERGNSIKLSFNVPDKTEFLWLVVLAGPSEHFWTRDNFEDSKYGYWPYTFTIKGAEPEKESCGL